MATTLFFGYVWLAYLMIYFTEHLMQEPSRHVRAQNNNETHYTAVLLGVLSGLVLRRRLI